jgi:hypothetical protein
MNAELLRLLAEQLVAGELAPNAFLDQIAGDDVSGSGDAGNESPATADLGDAQVDLDRARRCGYPEVIFAQGKSCDALCRIVARLAGDGIDVLATRVSVEQATVLAQQFAAGVFNPTARTYRLRPAGDAERAKPRVGRVAVVTAGTSDRPVAEEACETLDCSKSCPRFCRRTRSWWRPAWKERCRAWWADMWPVRWWRCRRAWATERALAAWRRSWECSIAVRRM